MLSRGTKGIGGEKENGRWWRYFWCSCLKNWEISQGVIHKVQRPCVFFQAMEWKERAGSVCGKAAKKILCSWKYRNKARDVGLRIKVGRFVAWLQERINRISESRTEKWERRFAQRFFLFKLLLSSWMTSNFLYSKNVQYWSKRLTAAKSGEVKQLIAEKESNITERRTYSCLQWALV